MLILQVFWGPILRVLLVLAVFGPSVLLILPVARSIQAASTLILSVLGVRNVLDTPSILGVWSILGAFVHRFKDLAIITPGFWDHVTGVYSISHFTGAPITRKYN